MYIIGYGTPAYDNRTAEATSGIASDFNIVEGRGDHVWVKGWAYDRANPTASLSAWAWIGGDVGKGVGIQFAFDGHSPDVTEVFGVGGSHRVEGPLYPNLNGTQPIYIYALDAKGEKSHLIYRGAVNLKMESEAPVISHARVENITPNGYRVVCKATDNVGIDRVEFPTWSVVNGRDDLVYHRGVKNGDEYYYDVKIDEHLGSTGFYTTHIYAYDVNGNRTGINLGSDILIPNAMGAHGASTYYAIDAGVLSGNWNEANSWVRSSWQGLNLGAHLATVASAEENQTVAEVAAKGGKSFYWLGASDYASEGTFDWVTGERFDYTNWGPNDPNGGSDENWLAVTASDGTWQDLPLTGAGYDVKKMGFIVELEQDSAGPEITDMQITQLDINGFTVSARVSDDSGISKVQFPVWTDDNGQDDDIIWGNADVQDGIATYRVNISDHGNQHGPYRCHVYAWDTEGNASCKYVKGSQEIIVPTATTTYGDHTYYLCDVGRTWDDASALAQGLLDGTDLSGQVIHLATITSEAEQSAVAALLKKGSKDVYWLGATDVAKEGSWTWVTGEAFNLTKWEKPNPNGGTDENWLGAVRQTGEWADIIFKGLGGKIGNMGFVVEVEPLEVDKPVAAKNLVYTGEEQTAVNEAAGYLLSGRVSATDAGEYVATAQLMDGYHWSDGTTDDVELKWTIAKAAGNSVTAKDTIFTYDGSDHELTGVTASKPGSTLLYRFAESELYDNEDAWFEEAPFFSIVGSNTLYVKATNPNYEDTVPVKINVTVNKARLTATYEDETVEEGETPALKMKVTGFVVGESAEDANGYETPTVKLPSTLAPGAYKLTPRGGSADDYDFEYVPGTLTVVAHKHVWGDWQVAEPASCTEAGTEQRICAGNASHTEKRSIDALGHDYVARVVAPTEDADGYTAHVCSRCGDSYTTDKVDSLSKQRDAAAAYEITQAIAALPKGNSVTLDDADAVQAARAAYDKLTDAQKVLVANLSDLLTTEARIKALSAVAQEAADVEAASAVDAKIAALPSGDALVYNDKNCAQVAEARAAYNALTSPQRTLVKRYDVLDAAERTLAAKKEEAQKEASDREAANAVSAAIVALPSPSKATVSDLEAIAAARALYSGLTEAQQALVDESSLVKAEEALQSAQRSVFNSIANGDITGPESVARTDVSSLALPEGADSMGVWTWGSSNSGVMSVDVSGKIRAKQVGTATITARCSYTIYGGEVLKVSLGKEISVYTISLDEANIEVASQKYTGAALAPTVSVTTASGDDVPADSYEVHYANNTVVGAANVTILGKGRYSGTASTAFEIVAADISGSSITGLTARTYTGKDQIQEPIVKLGGKTLAAGEEYKVSYKNNVKAGTATITVSGIGNYTGSKSATFKINPAASTIKLAAQSKTYTGKKLTYSGKVTKKGSTGKVTYKYYSDSACKKEVKTANVKAAKTYYVKATVAADANHKAATSKAVKFTIAKAANPLVAKATAKSVTTANAKKKAQVVAPLATSKAQGKVTYVKSSGAKCLTVNKSTGKVTVAKGTKAGTYTAKVKVTAAGNGNYKSGSKTVTVKVTIKSATKATRV